MTKTSFEVQFLNEKQAKELETLYNEQKKNNSDEIYGITERLSKFEHIEAEMQNYVKDFHIHEIDLKGKEVNLRSSFNPFKLPTKPNDIQDLPFVKKGLVPSSLFKFMVLKIERFRRPTDFFDLDVSKLSDRQTSTLHTELAFLEHAKPGLICFPATSKLLGNKKCLRVKQYDKTTDRKHLETWGWNEEKPYLHFVLRTVDTPFRKPLFAIAKALAKDPEDFRFAQLKEAFPVSYQWISVARPDLSLVGHLSRLESSYKVGEFVLKDEQLGIGDLKGNKYKIAFRGLQVKSFKTLTDSLEYLKSTGFVNYFGAKRFSCRRCVPTFEIGRALLCRNWQKAVELLLRPSTEDLVEIKQLKESWYLNKTVPEGFKSPEFEFKMIRKLQENPTGYLEALEEVPFNFRLGYVFAYQSYIWNVIAAQRVKRKRLAVEVGDIVWVAPREELKPEFLDDYGIPLYSSSQPYRKIERSATEKPSFKDKIRFVTEEDVKNKTYSVYDLVLPLPGSETMFPKNDVGIWYTDFLSRDGLSKTRLNDKYFSSEEIVYNSYFLRGTYRHIVLKVEDLKWDIRKYKFLDDPVILQSEHNKWSPSDEKDPSEQLALQLEFSLPPDSYVFNALREIFDLNASGLASMGAKMREARLKEEETFPQLKKAAEEKKPKKQVLDGKRSKERSKERSKSMSKPKTVERLDGGGKKKPAVERLDGGPPGRSVKTSKENFIQVRLTNPENVREPKGKKPFPRPIGEIEATFDARNALGPGRNIIDGVPVYEFNTVAIPGAKSTSSWGLSDSPMAEQPRVFGGRMRSRSPQPQGRDWSPPRRQHSPSPRPRAMSISPARERRRYSQEREQHFNLPDLRDQLQSRHREDDGFPKRAGSRISPDSERKLRRLDDDGVGPSPFDRLGPRFEDQRRFQRSPEPIYVEDRMVLARDRSRRSPSVEFTKEVRLEAHDIFNLNRSRERFEEGRFERSEERMVPKRVVDFSPPTSFRDDKDLERDPERGLRARLPLLEAVSEKINGELDRKIQEKLNFLHQLEKQIGETKVLAASSSRQKPFDEPKRGAFDDPKRSFDDPKRGFDDPKRGFDDPKSRFNDPKRAFEDPKRSFEDPKRIYDGPNRRFDDPKSRFDDPKSRFDDPKSRFDDPKGRFDDLKRSFDDPKSVFDNPKSRFDNSKGRFDDPKRSFDDHRRTFNDSSRSFEEPKRPFEDPKRPYDEPKRNFDDRKRPYDEPSSSFSGMDRPSRNISPPHKNSRFDQKAPPMMGAQNPGLGGSRNGNFETDPRLNANFSNPFQQFGQNTGGQFMMQPQQQQQQWMNPNRPQFGGGGPSMNPVPAPNNFGMMGGNPGFGGGMPRMPNMGPGPGMNQGMQHGMGGGPQQNFYMNARRF